MIMLIPRMLECTTRQTRLGALQLTGRTSYLRRGRLSVMVTFYRTGMHLPSFSSMVASGVCMSVPLTNLLIENVLTQVSRTSRTLAPASAASAGCNPVVLDPETGRGRERDGEMHAYGQVRRGPTLRLSRVDRDRHGQWATVPSRHCYTRSSHLEQD